MKIVFTCALFFISFITFAQDKKVDFKTKMDAFTSKTGVMTKISDVKLNRLKSIYGNHECRIRKITIPPASVYFLQIVNQGKYNNSTASIEFSDLIEVSKALSTLKTEVLKDILSLNYIENKFVTNDGFEIGYYIENNKPTWYLKLEKYGNDNTVFLEDFIQLENLLGDAKVKIEELKKQP